jgi:AcrR family transcriptional regulator
MGAVGRAGRANQQRRTRKDLLRAAARLMREGRRPTLEEVAEAALVSRATAYRYFSGIEALLLEASLDLEIPEAGALFPDGEARGDLVERLERVDTALHDMMLANEAPLRLMLANALAPAPRGAGERGPAVPRRQNRRSPLIEAAVEPWREEIAPEALDRLRQAVALIVGPEAMIVCKDVLQLDDAEARALKRWAIRALVEAARKRPAGR